MAKLKVVGMDPSMRHWGMCKGIYDTDTQELHLPESMTVDTEPAPENRKIPKNVYDIGTAEELMREVFKFSKGADVIYLECPVGTQSAQGMLAYGVVVALTACLKCAGLRVVVTTPLQGKCVVSGTKDPKANQALNVTKKDVITWVSNKHPELPLPRYKRNGEMLISMEQAEHMADACIAIYAGLVTEGLLSA